VKFIKYEKKQKTKMKKNATTNVLFMEDFFISAYGEQVQLDNCNFHNKVKLNEFRDSRVLIIQPPVGEVTMIFFNSKNKK